jgi:hypothetical protein
VIIFFLKDIFGFYIFRTSLAEGSQHIASRQQAMLQHQQHACADGTQLERRPPRAAPALRLPRAA